MFHRGLITLLLLTLGATGLLAQALQVTRQQGLDFGHLIAESPGGSLTLTPESQLILGADRRVRGFQTASPHGALFRITGPPGRRVHVELDPPSPIFQSPSGRLRIATFQLGLPSPDGQLNGQGFLDVFVGATLDVSAGNQSGLFLLNSAQFIVRDRDAKGSSREPDTFSTPCPIRAHVRAPLTLERKQDLSFGDILLRPEGGQLCVEPGGRYYWKDTRRPDFIHAKPRPAQFLVCGSGDAMINVQIPTATVMLRNAAGQTVLLKEFTTDVDRSIRLPDAGPLSFEIGATLVIGANQAPGAYSGTFTISVNYL